MTAAVISRLPFDRLKFFGSLLIALHRAISITLVYCSSDAPNWQPDSDYYQPQMTSV